MAGEGKSSHYPVLDGMRGVAAISVMAYHFTLNANVLIFQRGDAAVDLFFLLSGFVLAHAYGGRIDSGKLSLKQFLVKRFIRLYPMFFAGFVIGVPILWVLCRSGLASYSGSQLATAGLCNVFLLPYLNGGQTFSFQGRNAAIGAVFPINDPAWSLFFEMLGSVSFFWLAKFSKIWLFRTALISLLALVAYCSLINWQDRHQLGMNLNVGWGTDNLLGGLPRSLYGFACGALLYKLWISGANSIRWRWIADRGQFSIYLATFMVFLFPFAARGLYYLMVVLVVGPLLVLAGASAKCNSISARRVAYWLGWISYPLYCVHFPVGRLTWTMAAQHHLAVPDSSILVVIASLASIILAAVFTSVWEAPARSFMTRKLQ